MDDSLDPFGMDTADTVNNAIDAVTAGDTVDQSAAETARLYSQATDTGNMPQLTGDNNSLPVVSTSTVSGAANVAQLLGSAGTTATQLGTAIGNAQKQLASVVPNFKAGLAAGSSTNPLSAWLANASTTDKLLVGLSIVAIVVALK